MFTYSSELSAFRQYDPKAHQNQKERQNQKVVLNFQKNYPKNIFIPILDFLEQMDLKKDYEEIVGTKEAMEAKNVVSLNMIFDLLSSKWFIDVVDKDVLEIYICNKILINNKIKKKQFHLKIIRMILGCSTICLRSFKKQISAYVNKIAQESVDAIDIFKYSNIIIYFLTVIQNYLMDEAKRQIKCNYPLQLFIKDIQKEKEKSRQEQKLLIKSITNLMELIELNEYDWKNLRNIIMLGIKDSQEKVLNQYKISRQNQLWNQFNKQFVEKLFSSRHNNAKANSLAIKVWLENFKYACLNIQLVKIQFKPMVIIWPPTQQQ